MGDHSFGDNAVIHSVRLKDLSSVPVPHLAGYMTLSQLCNHFGDWLFHLQNDWERQVRQDPLEDSSTVLGSSVKCLRFKIPPFCSISFQKIWEVFSSLKNHFLYVAYHFAIHNCVCYIMLYSKLPEI